MMSIETFLTMIFFGFGLILPWVLALGRRWQARGEATSHVAMGWRPLVHSMLAYVLAFNITFFIQELFLVLPKALVPGLKPTLFHNNHDWAGDAAIAELFQGTGGLAILLSGFIFSVIASRQARPSFFILWMAFNGLFQSLPQFVVGAIIPGNDMGRAYDYLQLGTAGEVALALLAVAALPVAGVWLGRRFVATAWNSGQVRSAKSRHAYLLRVAGLATLAGLPLIILFRVPREPMEVLFSPILVPLFGFGWMQMAAFGMRSASAAGRQPVRLLPMLIAAVALLAIFQLVLRPGIPF